MPQSRRKPSPLTPARLEELALAYVARFATTGAKLEGYLARKLRERGWEGDGLPDLQRIAARFAEAGYIDDGAYARAKSDSLLRRGYGKRRIGEALRAAGVEEAVRQDVAPGERAARGAALALARRRRFGPWSNAAADPALRQKQVAAMLRAGHSLDIARQIVEATDADDVQAWVDSADGDNDCD